MSKVLIIAEKPSVARSIANVLGCNSSQKGFIEGTKYIITWAIGHLVTLYQPEDYDTSYSRWITENLPIIPEKFKLKIVNSTKAQYSIISRLINSPDVESIICATDAGREGELIFRFIYAKTGCSKPFKRLWLSSITNTAISKAMSNLKDGHEYDNLYHAALARSYADWIIGINLTRAFSMVLKGKYNAGRVLTPTLAILVERENDIQSFQSKTYYKIVGEFNNQSCQINAIYLNPKLSGKNMPLEFIERKKDAEKALAKIMARKSEPWIVQAITIEQKTEPPPLLYDLTELQHECNSLFGFTAEQTLSIVQELYEEKKVITYPRTDSRYLTTDMQKETYLILRKIAGIKGYMYYIDIEGATINNRIINDAEVTDHHAIIPTGEIPKALTQDAFRVFDLIVRRYLAVFMQDYSYKSVRASIVHKDVEGEFRLSWNEVLQIGWKAVYSLTNEKVKPEISEGEAVKLANASIKDVVTQPPERYTDGTLLTAMEYAGRFLDEKELKAGLGKGLGTPATRAETIEKLVKVEYVRREGKQLIPCEKGMHFIQKLENMPEITSPKLTAEWELKLQAIDRGETTFEEFMKQIKGFATTQVRKALKIK